MKQTAETLNVTLVQTNIQWEDKQANLQMLEDKIRAVKEKMEIVILPEMFSTGFTMHADDLAETMDGPAVAWMKMLSGTLNIILTGSLIIRDGNKIMNRLIWMLPNGTLGFYDKRHLFGYAKEDEHFSAGSSRLITSAKGWKLNMQVCYDLRFPLWARQARPIKMMPDNDPVVPEYDVLVYVANWPEKRKHAWKTLLQARAIENQCYVVGVNRTGTDGNNIYYSGDSMIVDPMGEVQYTAPHEEEIFTYSLSLDTLKEIRNRLPFLKDADPFIIGNQ